MNAIVCLSACGSRAGFGEQIVDCPHSEQIVRTVRRADGPRALTTGLPARLMQAVLPRAPASGLLLPRAPAAPTSRCRSDGPWDCRVQRQQWSWWPAVVACAVQHSLTGTGTDSRDDSDGRFLTVLSIYVGPGQQTITRRNLPRLASQMVQARNKRINCQKIETNTLYQRRKIKLGIQTRHSS